MNTDTPDPAATGDARMERMGRRHGEAVWRDGNPTDLRAAVAYYERKRDRDGKLSHFEQGMVDALTARITGETR